MVSTSDVLDRHLKSFAERDLDGVLADYASDAVLFVPTGPLRGPEAIKRLFRDLISEFAKPGSMFSMQHRCVEGDHAYIVWTAETADNLYEFATDTFFVQNGRIVAQSFAAKIKPKRRREPAVHRQLQLTPQAPCPTRPMPHEIGAGVSAPRRRGSLPNAAQKPASRRLTV